MTIGHHSYQTSFLIIPNHSNSVILGNDWLLKNDVIIDYQNLIIKVKEKILDSSLVSYGRKLSEEILLLDRQRILRIFNRL